MRNILFSFLLLFFGTSYAQLIVDNVPPGPKILNTPKQLAETVLVIPNPLYNPTTPQTVFPTNIFFNKSAANALIYNDQAGKWETNNNAGNLGLGKNEYGVLLTTGKTEVAFGPNNTPSASITTQTPSPPTQDDPDLAILANGYSVKNVSILEFDFVAQGYSVSFDYVFGSEEYPEYSNSAYNDAFGFFLSGPSIAGGKGYTNNAVNLALLPTSDTGIFDVTINNVNQIKNKSYYVSNGDGTTPATNTYTQYDGFTTLLKAKYVGLECGKTYHIKLAIGNVSDNSYDSAVFLKNFSASPPKLVIYGQGNNPTVCDGDPEPIKIEGDFPPGAIYTWTKDGVLLPDTGSTLQPTTSGQYCVDIKTSAPSNCPLGSDCIDVTVLPKIPIVPPVNKSVCTTLLPPYSPPFYFNIDQTLYMLNGLNPSDYEVTYYNSSYQDAYDGVPNGRIPNTDLANYPLATASQTIWVRIEAQFGNACVNVQSFKLDAFQYPVVPTGYVKVQPNCITPTGTIVVSSPIGVSYEYSIDGGTNYQANTVFSGLAQNISYTIIVKNIDSGCTSGASSPIVVNAVPGAPSTPIGTITQPNCITATATIVITSPLGATYEYSIDGGTNYQPSPAFSGLPPNIVYTITAKDINTGCISSGQTFTVNAIPANPNAPTASVTVQPTCTTPTGTVVITAPLGVNLEYSNGGVYQANTTFSGLTQNTTYNFTAKDIVTGCISAVTPILINAVPGLPATPTISITQPTCTTNTGAITITNPLGVNYEYSVGNTYQSGVAFSGLTAGKNYPVTVRDINTGCVSNTNTATISAPSNVPNPPTASTTVQPNCIIPTGTITVSLPLGPDLRYSNDGTNYQVGTTFTGLTSNKTYNITVKDNVSGCVSGITQVLVNPIPANPIAPVGTITHPNCIVATGTITITSPIGASLEYSNNSGIYQSSPVFSGLAPSSVNNIMVKDVNTGCISVLTTFTINAIPANPAMPVTTATQPTCATNTGSILVTSPTGAIYEYGIDGVYQSSANFTGLTAGKNYSITVKETATGCISTATTATINPALNVPVAPTASTIVQPTCTSPIGTIEVTAPLGVNLVYNIDNGIFQAGTTFSNLAPNTTYNIVVKDNVSGCASIATAVLVNPLPANPASPAGTITQPNCYVTTGTIVVTAPVGANYNYSIDGGINYQSNVTFTNFAPNTNVNINVKDITTGCIGLATIFTINPIPPNPVAPIATVSQPTCKVQVGRIDVTSPVGDDIEYSINSGATYQPSKAFINLPADAVYTVIVRNRVTGCVSSSSSFTINPIPSIPATPIASVNNNSPCENESFTLSTPNVIGAAYSWSGPNGFTSALQNPTVSDAILAMSGNYNVVIALTPDCPSLPGSVNVSVKPLPEPSLENGFVCVDAQTNTVISNYTLDANLSNATYSFQWYEIVSDVPTLVPSQTNSTYTVNSPGTYGVIATNKTTGCVSNMVTANVVASSPPVSMEIDTSNYFSSNQTITVNAIPSGNYLYQIDNGYFQSSNIFNNVPPGLHRIAVKDIEGCGELVGTAEIVDYPKFFTPNGDGYNDTWNIFSLSDQPKAKISIFDRYGKFLKQISPTGPGWDGTYNGKDLPSTDYWFNIDYLENGSDKIFRAHFTLKR